MSEDYTPTPERTYSAFWPLFIFLAAFVLSSFYQLYVVTAHRSFVNSQIKAVEPSLQKAKEAQTRLVALANDLLATAAKDNNAAQIVREAKQAGIIREQPTTNAAPANR